MNGTAKYVALFESSSRLVGIAIGSCLVESSLEAAVVGGRRTTGGLTVDMMGGDSKALTTGSGSCSIARLRGLLSRLAVEIAGAGSRTTGDGGVCGISGELEASLTSMAPVVVDVGVVGIGKTSTLWRRVACSGVSSSAAVRHGFLGEQRKRRRNGKTSERRTIRTQRTVLIV